jgi:hypothetical protein
VLRPAQRVLPRRRVQPPLRRLRAARAAHEPLVMIDLQCNVHTAICVLYQVGSPGWIRQKNTDIEEHEIRYRSKKSSISYTDIEGACQYREIFDIRIYRYRSFELRYRVFFDIVLDRYRMFLPSISMFSRFRAFDIECQNIRYRV